jgi:hypothetical protein
MISHQGLVRTFPNPLKPFLMSATDEYLANKLFVDYPVTRVGCAFIVAQASHEGLNEKGNTWWVSRWSVVVMALKRPFLGGRMNTIEVVVYFY